MPAKKTSKSLDSKNGVPIKAGNVKQLARASCRPNNCHGIPNFWIIDWLFIVCLYVYSVHVSVYFQLRRMQEMIAKMQEQMKSQS